MRTPRPSTVMKSNSHRRFFGHSEIDYGRKTMTERIFEALNRPAFDPPELPEPEDHSPPDEREPQTKQP